MQLFLLCHGMFDIFSVLSAKISRSELPLRLLTGSSSHAHHSQIGRAHV